MTSEDTPVPVPANPSPKSAARVRVVSGSLLLRILAESNLLRISPLERYISLGTNGTSTQKPSFEELRTREWTQGVRPLEQAHQAFSGGSKHIVFLGAVRVLSQRCDCKCLALLLPEG